MEHKRPGHYLVAVAAVKLVWCDMERVNATGESLSVCGDEDAAAAAIRLLWQLLGPVVHVQLRWVLPFGFFQ